MMLKNEYEQGSKGFLYYAHNNGVIDYLRLAICSALTGKYQIPTFRAMVITDDESLASLNEEDRSLLNRLFEEIKIDNGLESENKRLHQIGISCEEFSWYNGTRPNAYTDSIYDETIMIDVDFLFQDSNLNKLWGSNTPILMNKDVIRITNNHDSKRFNILSRDSMIGEFTVPMYWATVVYFNRSDTSKEFFDLVNHIKDNYFYYQALYQTIQTRGDQLYRNDFSFSIALYMINGFVIPGAEWEIPYKFVLSYHNDLVFKIDKGQIKMIIETERGKPLSQLFNVQKTSLHCMNKISLQQKYNDFLGIYDNE